MQRIIAFIVRYVYAAASCLYLFTFGFFIAKNRSFISTICAHFGYTQKTGTIIPEIELSQLVSVDTTVQILEPIRIAGNVTLLDIAVIAQLIKHYNPNRLFEIGTFDGRTTLNMAANCSEEAEIYTLDLPREQLHSTKLPIDPVEEMYIDKETSGSRYMGTDYEKKITQLYGDSATFDFSQLFSTIDFMFIDGAHSYEYVLNDSEKARRLLKDGRGVIIWHDYGDWEGTTRALNELYSENEYFRNLKHISGTSLACLIAD